MACVAVAIGLAGAGAAIPVVAANASPDSSPKVMAQVSLTTGGQAFDATSAKRLTSMLTELAGAIAAPPTVDAAVASVFKEASERDDHATSLRIDMTYRIKLAGRTVALSANGIELPRRHDAAIQVNISRSDPQLGEFQEVGFGHYIYVRVPDYSTLKRRYSRLKPWVSIRIPAGEVSPSSGAAASFTDIFDVVPLGRTIDGGVTVERYSAELDLSGALSANSELQALAQQSSALRSLFEKPIKVSFDVGDDGYLRREQLALDLPINGASLKEDVAISLSGFDTPVRPIKPPPRGQIMTYQLFQAEVAGAVSLPVVI